MRVFLESTDLLETISDESQKNSATAQALAGQLNESQLNWKPAPKSWSIAQCLQHLTVSTEKFGEYFTKAIAQGREKRPAENAPAYRPTLLGGWLIKQVLPESTRKVPAPKVFRPVSSEIDRPLEKLLAQQEKFLAFVRATKGIDYNKIRLRSPVTPLMRYSLADAYVLTVVHAQRHLGQARRVRETTGFPI
jgi:hypothetical protein